MGSRQEFSEAVDPTIDAFAVIRKPARGEVFPIIRTDRYSRRGGSFINFWLPVFHDLPGRCGPDDGTDVKPKGYPFTTLNDDPKEDIHMKLLRTS